MKLSVANLGPEVELTRRHFFGRTSMGAGIAALAYLLRSSVAGEAVAKPAVAKLTQSSGLDGLPHFAPRAKQVIFLYQSGAPSQIELFDYKPELAQRDGDELPESVRMGQRLTTMTSDQKTKPLTPSLFKFAQHGTSGAYISELLPHTAKVVDELCFIRSLYTDAINHDPAITFMQTGSQQPGRPSFGAWVSYGLGTENQNLPAFIVLVSGGEPGDQPLFGRLWGPGFLPSQHQAVQFRAGKDPILYLSNPAGISPEIRQQMLAVQSKLNHLQFEAYHDPEIQVRIAQYELAGRMQLSAPELTDLSQEPQHIFDLYGNDARKPGTYAAHCLLARRMIERGVRFVQLYHRGWDHHDHLPNRIRMKCDQTDQATGALIADLKQRDLLKDTLVVWAGEFGRTAYCQGQRLADDYGRDHHPRCSTVWLAGGGVKAGYTHGRTDDFSYNVVENPVHVHDLQATLLHLLGIDHERLTYQFQGRHFRLTDVGGEVVKEVIR